MDLGWGRGQNTTFFQNKVMLHLKKGNDTCINMVAKIFAYTPPPTLGWGQKDSIHLFQNMVTLHIKLKEMTNAIRCTHTFCPYTHPRSLGWGQRSNHFFSENSHVAYQINRNGAKGTMQELILGLYGKVKR